MAQHAKLQGLKAISASLYLHAKVGSEKRPFLVNLACALHAQGHRVGIFDADLYGPSSDNDATS